MMPFSEKLTEREQRAKPGNKIKVSDRKRFTREEVEAAIKSRSNYSTTYQNR